MPTIPRFHVTQDAAWVFVHVHVPYVRVGEMEFDVDGTRFSFYCKPFLLKLQFPHEVVDDELAKAVYDPNKDHGTIVVHLLKKEPGLEFPDLDLLTKLLQPKEPKLDLGLHASRAAPLIEVLHSDAPDTGTESSSDALAGSRNGAELQSGAPATTATAAKRVTSSSLLDLEQRIAEPEAETVRITDLKPTYGFNNAYSDFFRVWHGEVSEIVSLPNPEGTPASQRRALREAAEDEQFDIERYLLDFINQDDDMYFALAMEYEPFWRQYPVLPATAAAAATTTVVAPPVPPAPKKPLIMEVAAEPLVAAANATEADVITKLSALELSGDASSSLSPPPAPAQPQADIFTDADRELLLRLPHKEFLIAREQEAVICGGLVDILIGFTYDHLTTQGDSGIESTWTASIVSPTLAWLDTTGDLAAVVRTAVRRILSFPFLRQYELALHVVRETAAILQRGKRVVLRALLALYRVVEKSETQYLLNTLYVQDYCVWVQSVSDDALVRLGERLARHASAFTKADSGWALEEIERSLLEADEDADAEEDEDASESSSDESESSEEDASGDEDSDEEDGAPAPADAMSTRTLKLPFLCARPGNVGVQIDSYRTMTMFHRPRCGKFTAHFLGIPFENASMDNYSRVVERTSKRTRIVEDRLAKLRARQQEILDDTEQRQRRRGEREATRQRKVWLHHQSLKKRDQRQREEEAAIVIQRYTRGMLGRLERDSRLHDREQDRAAQTLQRSSKAFLRRKRNARRALERQKERQMQAATVLQRQARKRLALASRKHHQKLGDLSRQSSQHQ